jgi:hypothetical protein
VWYLAAAIHGIEGVAAVLLVLVLLPRPGAEAPDVGAHQVHDGQRTDDAHGDVDRHVGVVRLARHRDLRHDEALVRLGLGRITEDDRVHAVLAEVVVEAADQAGADQWSTLFIVRVVVELDQCAKGRFVVALA